MQSNLGAMNSNPLLLLSIIPSSSSSHHYCYYYSISSFSSSSSSRRLTKKATRFGTTTGNNFFFFSYYMMMSTSSSSASSSCSTNVLLLEGVDDDHDGVIVDITSTSNVSPDVFASSLRASLSHWRHLGKKGIWIKIPIHLVILADSAVKEGFCFHHAEPTYLMLVLWLPTTTPNTLPINATHRVGIGAFVLNQNNQVLVVQEKNGRFRGTGVWKFPTGVVDEAEDICDAAVREVKEETGVDSKFIEVLAFRQSHKAFFDKSDLFFLCMLQPLSSDIQPQESEIEAAQWMPYEEYAAQPIVQKHELLRYILDICTAKKDRDYSGFSPVPTRTGFSETSYLYLNKRDL